jgi:hypothetical protein
MYIFLGAAAMSAGVIGTTATGWRLVRRRRHQSG